MGLTPCTIDKWDSIVNIELVGSYCYYDFHVPGTNNYWAAGVFHHNSAKTRLCDALLVSHHCHALEHMTGFHSGWNDGSGEDFSLLARIDRKTLITPEGDVLMSSPRFVEIMSQQRRIFDGTSGASYKTKKTDVRYTGLRTPWIIAGTPALMDCDQSRLGDRFIRVCIDPPADDEVEDILARVAHAAMREVREESNGDASSCLEGDMLNAYQLTGGYVNWLRANATQLLASIKVDGEAIARCAALAQFSAMLRARPHPDKRKDEVHDSKELPTRLTKQYMRLAMCVAVVLNRQSVDDEALKRVTKVALDTSRGRTLNVADRLYKAGTQGIIVAKLSVLTGESEDRERSMLQFMAKIGAVEVVGVGTKGIVFRPRWRLTSKMTELWQEVQNAKD